MTAALIALFVLGPVNLIVCTAYAVARPSVVFPTGEGIDRRRKHHRR